MKGLYRAFNIVATFTLVCLFGCHGSSGNGRQAGKVTTVQADAGARFPVKVDPRLNSFGGLPYDTNTPNGGGPSSTAGHVVPIFYADLANKHPSGGRDSVLLDGHHVSGIGGGQFAWVSTSTAPSDGGIVAQVTGTAVGRWIRIFTEGLEPEWYGAIGDGVTDDTSAINTTIAAAGNGGKVRFHASTYLTTSPILAENISSLTLQGASGIAGVAGTQIIGQHSGKTVLSLVGSNLVQLTNIVLTGNTLASVPLTGTVSVTNTGAGVTGTGTSFTTQIAVGQFLTFGNQPTVNYVVATVTDNTHLSLTTGFTGATNAATTSTNIPCPKTALLLGRSSPASAGGHNINNVQTKGTVSVAGLYIIASEINNFASCDFTPGKAGVTGTFIDQSDPYGVGGLTGSSQEALTFLNSSMGNFSTDPGTTGIFIQAGSASGHFKFINTFVFKSGGDAFVKLAGDADGSDIERPIEFHGIFGETVAPDPTYGFLLFSTSGGRQFTGLTIDEFRFQSSTGPLTDSIFAITNGGNTLTLLGSTIKSTRFSGFPAPASLGIVKGSTISLVGETAVTVNQLLGSHLTVAPGVTPTIVTSTGSIVDRGDGLSGSIGTGNLTCSGSATIGTFETIGSTPASVGALRLSNNTGVFGRNSTNSGDIRIAQTDASNNVFFGDPVTGNQNFFYASVLSQFSDGSHYMQVIPGATATLLANDGINPAALKIDADGLGGSTNPLYWKGTSINVSAGGTFTLAAPFNPHILLFGGAIAADVIVDVSATKIGEFFIVDPAGITLAGHVVSLRANGNIWGTTIAPANLYRVAYGQAGKLYGTTFTP